MSSVCLIETTGVRATVATEFSVSGPNWPDRLSLSAGGFTKGWKGVPPPEKRTAQTTSQPMTATTTFQNRLLNPTKTHHKEPYRAWTGKVHQKIHQESLDTEGSFRDEIRTLVRYPCLGRVATVNSCVMAVVVSQPGAGDFL